jgi:hypothetical protein
VGDAGVVGDRRALVDAEPLHLLIAQTHEIGDLALGLDDDRLVDGRGVLGGLDREVDADAGRVWRTTANKRERTSA